uniref:Uncharacterized protein n=1 Tax=viral metagenome TaxID=1070528 RepID=A0A6C0BNW7_9ZZZZ
MPLYQSRSMDLINVSLWNQSIYSYGSNTLADDMI